MRYCRNCRKNVADEFKFCPVCGAETEESKEEILFPTEEIANLKTELAFTKDDLNRNINFLKDEIKKIGQKNYGEIKILKKVHVFSLAAVLGLTGVIIGFIEGILYMSIISIIMTPALLTLFPQLQPMLVGGGIILILLITIIFGVGGFIVGAIYALVYNFVASATGGVKITLSSDDD